MSAKQTQNENNTTTTTFRAYATLEDWSSRGDSRRQDEANIDAILFALSQDELAAIYAERGADERPLLDALERRIEDAVFASWESRPRSGHSIIITVEAGAFAIVDDCGEITICQTGADLARYVLRQRHPNLHGVRYVEDDGELSAFVWWHEGRSDTYEHVAWVDSEDELTDDEVLARWVADIDTRSNNYGLGDNTTVYTDRSEIMEVMADVEEDDPEEWARLRDMAVRAGWLGAGA